MPSAAYVFTRGVGPLDSGGGDGGGGGGGVSAERNDRENMQCKRGQHCFCRAITANFLSPAATTTPFRLS